MPVAAAAQATSCGALPMTGDEDVAGRGFALLLSTPVEVSTTALLDAVPVSKSRARPGSGQPPHPRPPPAVVSTALPLSVVPPRAEVGGVCLLWRLVVSGSSLLELDAAYACSIFFNFGIPFGTDRKEPCADSVDDCIEMRGYLPGYALTQSVVYGSVWVRPLSRSYGRLLGD